MNTIRLNRVLEFSMSFESNVWKMSCQIAMWFFNWTIEDSVQCSHTVDELIMVQALHWILNSVRVAAFSVFAIQRCSTNHFYISVVCSTAQQTKHSWSLPNFNITCIRRCRQSISHWIGKMPLEYFRRN